MNDREFLIYLKERIESLNDKVDTLVEFRARVLGIVIALSSIVSLVISLYMHK